MIIKYKFLIYELIKNIIFSLIFFFSAKFLLLLIHESSKNLNFLVIIFLFFFSSLFYFFLSKNKNINRNLLLIIGFAISVIFIYLNNTLFSLIFLSLFFALDFYLITIIIYSKNNIFNFIKRYVVFVLHSFLIFVLFLIKINFSIDEGFIILCFVIYLMLITLIHLSLIISQYIWSINYRNKKNFKPLILNLIILFLIIFSSLLGYWNSLNLFDKNLELSNTDYNSIFQLINQEDTTINNHETATKNDLIEYLKKNHNSRIDILGCLYILTGNEEWGEKFKNILLEEAKKNKFIGIKGSVKAWQMQISNRLYYYIKIKNNSKLFSQNENGIVLTWTKYKRKTKISPTVSILKGDIKINQLVNRYQGNGMANKIFSTFINNHYGTTLYLDVKADNERAINFYKKNNFKVIGEKLFGKNMKGLIMKGPSH